MHNDQDCFSLLHNNVRSPKRNHENLHVHLIHELDSNFSVIGVTETKIARAYSLNFNPNLPNYEFEYVPTPLSCGGVGIYFSSSLSYILMSLKKHLLKFFRHYRLKSNF